MEEDINFKIEEILNNLTLEEKASFCSGKNYWYLKDLERLNIPTIIVSDGPHGLRKQDGNSDNIGLNQSLPATCFPTAAGMAATWNTSLIGEIGKALGEECQQENISVLLGPAINIKRSPLCGRNFEYFSEDPHLTGALAVAMINGIQSKGVGTSVKHFAANNQESYRMTIDTLVDERAYREIYLYAFEKAVKEAHPWTIMPSYNKINGTYACENSNLLTDILRKEWGFEGLAISDWGAVNDRVSGITAGLDLEMPGNKGMNDKLIVEAAAKGTISEEVLNDTVRRLLKFIFKAERNKLKDYKFDKNRHYELARRAAAESMVLLKNTNNILPIKGNGKIALIGEFAKVPRYQGAGSSLVNPLKLENAYDCGKELFGNRLHYTQGYSLKTDSLDHSLLDEAVQLAKLSDTVIIMAGLPAEYESEGFDRLHMRMPESHNVLINAVSKVNSNVIVVLNNGSPVEMPWVNDVPGIIEAYLPGETGGSAIWDVILGKVNPSGRLAESFPLHLEDNISSKYFPMGPENVEYRESIYVGYRYFDKAGKQPLFPFGYGLSYTDFNYSDLKLSKTRINDDEILTVSLIVKNTGRISGMEVVQLYVKDIETSIFKAEKELKGFCKIALESGEERTVEFILDKRSFAYYNTSLKEWHVESGEFSIMIGSSSRDIKCEERVYVKSTAEYSNSKDMLKDKISSYYSIGKVAEINRNEFISLLNTNINEVNYSKKPYHRNSTVEDIKNNFVGRILYWIVMKQVKGMSLENELQIKMMQTTACQLPLRSLVMLSNGMINFNQIDAVIHLMNCSPVKSLKALLKK